MPPRTVRNPIAEFYQRLTRFQWTLIGSLFAFLVLGYAVWDAFRDDPPPDVSDLLIDIQPVPDEENGMVLLEEIGNELIALQENPSIDELLHPDQKDAPIDWDQVGKNLKQKREVMARIPEIFEKPYFQAYALWERPGISGATESYFILYLLDTRIKWAIQNDKMEQAWQDTLLLLQLGHRFQTGEMVTPGYFFGFAATTTALLNLKSVLPKLTPTPEVTRRRTDRLKTYFPTDAMLNHILLTEFFFNVKSIMRFHAQHVEREYGVWKLVLYKPHRTLRLQAIKLRENLSNIGKLPTQLSFQLSRAMLNHSGPINSSGREVLFGLEDHMFNWAHLIRANFVTTQVGLALAGYANQHNGNLPETLEELVPDYIDAIPLDPMDGEPLRYDRVARKVWSIGKDLIDHLGVSNEDDIVVKIPLQE